MRNRSVLSKERNVSQIVLPSLDSLISIVDHSDEREKKNASGHARDGFIHSRPRYSPLLIVTSRENNWTRYLPER